MSFPNPDMPTTNRLLGTDKAEVGELSSEILSAIVCFLIGSVGHDKTADILRDWAANIMRTKLVKQNIS